MSVAHMIAAQLPLLRRYARALSGSQESGDAYIVALLETLVADPSLFTPESEPREEIYRLFSRIWNATPLNAQEAADPMLAMHDRQLDAITPLPRQAFLLTAMEEFDPAQAARILGVAPAAFDSLIEQAGQEIGALVASKVVIVEDEPLTAMALEQIVSSLGHVAVGPARTQAEAVALIRSERPGLVLADIHLADGGSGLAAVNEILASFGVPVIFITAYPELLLTGERPEPTFLVAKPFRDDHLKAMISQALFFQEMAQLTERLSV